MKVHVNEPGIQWFKDPQDPTPCTALVMEAPQSGWLSLLVWVPNAVAPQIVRGVPHRKDPIVQANPQRVRHTGIWDWVPGYEPREPQPTAVSNLAIAKKKQLVETA